MLSLTSVNKSKTETAAFDSDGDVLRVLRKLKFIVGRVPIPNLANPKDNESFYQISCDPSYDLRQQTIMFERALIELGYTTKEIRKNVAVSGMAQRFIMGVSQLGTVLYYMDKGLVRINFTMTSVPDKWAP